MGYAITRYGGKNGRPADWFEFVVDEAEDLTSLPPAAAGSVAYCSGDGKNYIMNVSGSWVEKQSSGGGSGSDLPDVTSADNGKVLTVVNGDWGVASAGGGGALVVEFTYNASDTTYTSTSPASDVITAFFAGTPVLFHFPGDAGGGAPNDIVKTVTWILRPPEGASGSTEIGFDGSEQYITYSGIEDDHIVCSLYIPD